jgi:hypothetical protein
MKRIVILLCLVVWATGVDAQHSSFYRSPVKRASMAGVEYHNFSRTWQNIDLSGKDILIFAPTLRGIAFTTGHSFLLHERPLLRVIHFGFDATWFDMEYGNWRRRIDGHGKWMHKVDVAIGAGPAIHFSPWRRLGIHLYFHYDPTLSVVTHNFAGDEDGKFEFVAGYASYFSSGLALSWDIFSIGAEYRHGGGTYRGIRIPDITISPDRVIDELLDFGIKNVLDRERHTMRGWRVYLSLRF